MVLPLEVLLEVFRFLNRDVLEFGSVINRSANQVVNKYFPSEPYRIQSDMILGVKSVQGQLRFFFYKVNSQCLISKELCINTDYSYKWITAPEPVSPSLHYSFEVIRPFLIRPYVRIPRVHFWIDDTPYGAGDVAELANITHIWQCQDVSIDTWGLSYYQYHQIGHIITSSTDLLLSSQYFGQCKSLKFDNIHRYVQLHTYPNIYQVKVLHVRSNSNPVEIHNTAIDMIVNKILYGESKLEVIVIYFTQRRYSLPLLTAIRANFLSASVRNNFRLLVPFRVSHTLAFKVDPFWLTRNNVTNEVLELKQVSGDEAPCYVNDEYYLNHKCSWNVFERRIDHT